MKLYGGVFRAAMSLRGDGLLPKTADGHDVRLVAWLHRAANGYPDVFWAMNFRAIPIHVSKMICPDSDLPRKHACLEI